MFRLDTVDGDGNRSTRRDGQQVGAGSPRPSQAAAGIPTVVPAPGEAVEGGCERGVKN